MQRTSASKAALLKLGQCGGHGGRDEQSGNDDLEAIHWKLRVFETVRVLSKT